MKFFFFFSVVFFSMINLLAQDNQADMMKAWQEYMTPGPMHEILAKGVGEWKGEITSWNAPSAPPTKSEGTSKYESILGGRYFQGKYTGNFMGMPMEGMEITGYDNAKKKFFSAWIDNFGTGLLLQEGTYDDKTGTINYAGSYTDFYGKETKVRQTVKYPDNDHGITEMYMVDENGKEFKSMEIKYTRVK